MAVVNRRRGVGRRCRRRGRSGSAGDWRGVGESRIGEVGLGLDAAMQSWWPRGLCSAQVLMQSPGEAQWPPRQVKFSVYSHWHCPEAVSVLQQVALARVYFPHL